MSKNNFNLSDSLIDAVKKIHDDEIEKQATSASDAEEKAAQFLVDQAERIAKYSKQVFGEIDEGIGNMVKLAKEKKKLKVRATKDYIKVAKEKAAERKVKEEVEPEEQIDELSKKTLGSYLTKSQSGYSDSADKRYRGKSIELAKKKIIPARVPASEEVESEEQIDEKYLGFKKLEGKLAGKGVRNPGAVAASIGRKKYGAGKFNKAAHEHHKMKGMKAEEVEQLDELSKKTLGSYTVRAAETGKRTGGITHAVSRLVQGNKKTIKQEYKARHEDVDYIEEAMKQRIFDKVMELRNKDK